MRPRRPQNPTAIDVQVDQLASAQTTIAAMYSPMGTTIGLGTLNIEVGNWNSSFSSFTTNPNWPKARVMTGPGDPTIERLRDKINGAGMGSSPTSSATPPALTLILKASATGGRTASVSRSSLTPPHPAPRPNWLNRLAFNPPENPQGMALQQAGQDAQLVSQWPPPSAHQATSSKTLLPVSTPHQANQQHTGPGHGQARPRRSPDAGGRLCADL